jgi:hypothetical protein
LGEAKVGNGWRLERLERGGQSYFACAKFLKELDGIDGRHNETKIHQDPASSRANLGASNLIGIIALKAAQGRRTPERFAFSSDFRMPRSVLEMRLRSGAAEFALEWWKRGFKL